MEYRYMMCTEEQNTYDNGYGPDNTTSNGLYMAMWAKFYQIDYFPCYEEALENEKDYLRVGDALFNQEIYKTRVKYGVEVFLKEANSRAQQQGKKAICHAVTEICFA